MNDQPLTIPSLTVPQAASALQPFATATARSSPYSLADIRRAFSGLMFFEKGHRYKWRGEWLKSTTSVVKEYVPPFDARYWSAYVALRDSGQQVWPLKDRTPHQIGTPSGEFTPEEVERMEHLPFKPASIRRAWNKKAQSAAAHGTLVHAFAEAYMAGRVISPVCRPLHEWFTGQAHITPIALEVVVGDLDMGWAGQADGLVWNHDTRTHELWDYKTNQEMKFENPYQNMLPPFDHLEDCFFNHYRLQMSIYAYMLAKAGFPVDTLRIIHVPSGGEMVVDYIAEPIDLQPILR